MNRELTYVTKTGSHAVRVVGTPEDPLFVAADVCAALGLEQQHKALLGFDSDEKGRTTLPTPGGTQELVVVTEPGLYRLIMRSRKPEARRFARWVTHEVLPSIRRTGSYRREPLAFLGSDVRTDLLRADLLTAERLLTLPPVLSADTDRLKAAARRLLDLHSLRVGRGLDALLPSAPAGAPTNPPPHVFEGGVYLRVCVYLVQPGQLCGLPREHEVHVSDLAAGLAPRLRGTVPPAEVDVVVEAVARRLFGDAPVAEATKRALRRGLEAPPGTVTVALGGEGAVVTAALARDQQARDALTEAAQLVSELSRPGSAASRVLAHVRAHPGDTSGAVLRATRGNRVTFLAALKSLERAGLIRHTEGARGAHHWFAVEVQQ